MEDRRKHPFFDPTINLGDVIVACGLIAAGSWWASNAETRMAQFESFAVEQRSYNEATRLKFETFRLELDAKRVELRREINERLARIEDKQDRLLESLKAQK